LNNTSIEGCGWNTADGRYLAEGNDRKIRENETSAEELKSQIAAATDARSTIEAQISIIQDELGRSESYRSNINFKIRLERLIWIVWPRLGRNLILNIKIRWRRRRLLLIRYVASRPLGRSFFGRVSGQY
jgi:hypothetical protein